MNIDKTLDRMWPAFCWFVIITLGTVWFGMFWFGFIFILLGKTHFGG